MKLVCQGRIIFLSFAALLLTPLASLLAAELSAPAPLRLSSPRDYEVRQRATRAEGKIAIAGTLPKDTSDSGAVEARLVGAGAADAWHKLSTFRPGMTEFRAELNAPAGGWYR